MRKQNIQIPLMFLSPKIKGLYQHLSTRWHCCRKPNESDILFSPFQRPRNACFAEETHHLTLPRTIPTRGLFWRRLVDMGWLKDFPHWGLPIVFPCFPYVAMLLLLFSQYSSIKCCHNITKEWQTTISCSGRSLKNHLSHQSGHDM